MPLLKLETTVVLNGDTRKTLLETLSKIVAETIGKPEDYVMVSINSAAIIMSGQPGEAAFVEVRSIGGLGGQAPARLSSRVCALLHDSLGIAQNRIYLNFTEVKATNWGWKGETFG